MMMNQSGPEHLNRNGDQEGTGLSRRRLLKAAATAAPLIATLPSGAAQATASAYQCIIDNRDATQGAGAQVPGLVDALQSPPYDKYIRVSSTQSTWTNGSDSVQVVQIENVYYVSVPLNSGLTLGSTFITTGWTGPADETTVWVLRYFQATSPTNVLIDPTGIIPCSGGTSFTDPQCLFPRSQSGFDLAGPLGQNMGLTTSCLTSVSV